MKQFWALSIYGMDTRIYLRSGFSKPAEISSNDQGLNKNAGGSVDLDFGPAVPKGWDKNWLQT